MPEQTPPMMHYTPLDSEETDDKPLISSPSSSSPPPPEQRIASLSSRAFVIFLITSIVSILLSLLNLTILSSSQTYRNIPKPLKSPSVYIGLDRVKYKEKLCRNRVVYPVRYWTFKGEDIKAKKQVLAPEDRVILSFGGDVGRLIFI